MTNQTLFFMSEKSPSVLNILSTQCLILTKHLFLRQQPLNDDIKIPPLKQPFTILLIWNIVISNFIIRLFREPYYVSQPPTAHSCSHGL